MLSSIGSPDKRMAGVSLTPDTMVEPGDNNDAVPRTSRGDLDTDRPLQWSGTIKKHAETRLHEVGDQQGQEDKSVME
jgi:hypothetical protein